MFSGFQDISLFDILLVALGSLAWGIFTYRYAEWKVVIGPEEEDEEDLKGRELLRSRLRRGEREWLRERRLGAAGMAYLIVTCALWFLLEGVFGFSTTFVMYAVVASLLCSLSYVDIRIQELPPELNLAIGAIGAAHLATDLPRWWEYLLGMVLVSGLFLIVGLISSGGAMGLGDVKMMAALGLLLGWKHILLVMVVGCLLGTIIHLPMMAIHKKGRQLSFGPYLAAAAIITICWGDRILGWYLGMMRVK